MKSPWDGFLPIKEQIKDESDTSNSFDEIVKDEIMLYDSSFGIMDSKLDHFTPVDKSEYYILILVQLDVALVAEGMCLCGKPCRTAKWRQMRSESWFCKL
uniref:Uncharacterized protein n=1 Tax=Timema poppense TaxID=170557 RepID=A0A7R9HBC1_TIMPO|nr:unnamed protein product [Timema poppensis]